MGEKTIQDASYFSIVWRIFCIDKRKKFSPPSVREEFFVVIDKLVSYLSVDLAMLEMMERCPEIVPNIILDLCQVFSHVYPSGTRRFVYRRGYIRAPRRLLITISTTVFHQENSESVIWKTNGRMFSHNYILFGYNRTSLFYVFPFSYHALNDVGINFRWVTSNKTSWNHFLNNICVIKLLLLKLGLMIINY